MSKRGPRKFMIVEALRKPPPKDYLHTDIPAGMAMNGPPLGPQLGPLGINIAAFCKDFNNRTEQMRQGVPLPCELNVKPDRTFDLDIYHPTSKFLLMQAAGIETESWDAKNFKVGQLTIRHIYEIAFMKQEDKILKLTPLRQLVETYVEEARALGIEIVKKINGDEYGEYLIDKKRLIEEHLAAIEAEKEEKLLRK